MPIALAALVSLVPVLLWLAFFYTRDRYEREPKWLIARLFLWGLIAGPWASGVNLLLAEFLAPAVEATYDSALALAMALLFAMVALSALNEETMKYVVVSSRTRGDPNFNEPIDGIIYMTTAALGFAAGENFVYILNTYFGVLSAPGGTLSAGVSRAYIEAFLVLAPMRALLSTLGHVSWSGIVGYYLSGHVLAKATGRTLVGGILLAAAFHTAFNMPLFLTQLGFPVAWISWIVWVASLERFITLLGRALNESPFRRRQLGVSERTSREAAGSAYARIRRGQLRGLAAIGVAGVAALAAASTFQLPADVGFTAVALSGLGAVAYNRFGWRCPACNAYLGRTVNPTECRACRARLR
jgi:RsiW-degrading membrane proteinase PrsW (M82 family)